MFINDSSGFLLKSELMLNECLAVYYLFLYFFLQKTTVLLDFFIQTIYTIYIESYFDFASAKHLAERAGLYLSFYF